MTPSKYQQGIFDFVQSEQGNAVVRAVAGSGKTTTLVESFKLVKGSGIFLAFNKSIATELASRCPPNVQARTFHSLCYRPVLAAVGAKVVDTDKIKNLIKRHLTQEEGRVYGAFVLKLVGLARNAGIGVLIPDYAEEFMKLVDHHELTLEYDDANEQTGVNLARDILSRSNQTNTVDFDDLLYFAVLKGVRLPKFDWVFVDEAQDTNAVQRAILGKIINDGGRLVAVGDAAQSIYGFRGADSDAMDLIASDFAPCKDLPLSVTYRCAKRIVEVAKEYVPKIEAAPNAKVGEVCNLQYQWKLTDFGPTDLIVCRNTKPLLDLGFRLLRARIPLRILGRDIGDGLIALIRKCEGKTTCNMETFVQRVEDWRERETDKALAKDLEAKADAIADKAGTLLMLVDELPEGNRTTAELIRILQSLFTDVNSRVTLATIHKAKGLEADSVWWLAPSLCPSRWAKQPWQQQQERNLMYVAVTRAKTKLSLIELPKRS